MDQAINSPEQIQERYPWYYGLDLEVTPAIPMVGILGWTGSGWSKLSGAGGDTTVNIATGTLPVLSISGTLADDATYALPDAKSGVCWCFIGDAQESAQFTFKADGSVSINSASGNVMDSDIDGNLCIFSTGTTVGIKNRLGSLLKIGVFCLYA